MKKIYIILIASALAAYTLAQSPPDSKVDEEKFVFPKGSENKGRLVFETKMCHRCHTLDGEKFPEIDIPPIDHISLSAIEHNSWTRDDFAHHVMDPQHIMSPQHQKAMIIIGDRIGAESSPMPSYTDNLTVQDLINVATYLESASKSR